VKNNKPPLWILFMVKSEDNAPLSKTLKNYTSLRLKPSKVLPQKFSARI
jgi:hypothetical protein